MTISASLRAGWASALSCTRLVAIVWLWGAILALSAAIPVWRWLARALNESPYADMLLQRFSIGFFTELTQYDRFSPLLMVNGEVLALLVLGLLSNPLVAAGVLEVIVSRDGRPLLHRFMRGAGHFYGRFLRLLVVTAIASAILVIAIVAAISPLVRALGESSYERLWITAALARLALPVVAAGLMMIAADIARAGIVLAETEVRGMVRAWWRAFTFVFRHFGTVIGTYLALVILGAVALLAYLLVVNAVPTMSWIGIAAAFVIQQAFMIVRAWLRVMRAGASVELVRSGLFAPAAVPVMLDMTAVEPSPEPEEALLP